MSYIEEILTIRSFMTDDERIKATDAFKPVDHNGMQPFEAAAGCDAVEIGHLFPDLIIDRGIDKRILARSN